MVVDAASADGTAAVAERAGAVVWQEAELMPSHGPVLGKGDAMWRALSVLEGELVCFLDADTEGFSAHFATGPARAARVRAGRVVRQGASTAGRSRHDGALATRTAAGA